MPEKVLMAGNNVRNVAESANKAGYEVYALTKFADADLRIYCRSVVEIRDNLDEREVKKLVEEKSEEIGAKIILCSGFETLDVKGDLLCNEPRTASRVADKLNFYRELERAGLPFPELLSGDEKGIVKPRKGGGGEEIRVSSEVLEGCIKQRFIKGVPCSVSLIASDGKAVPIACNFIYAGWKEMNAAGFRYSGNLTPLVVGNETRRMLEKLAVEAVELFGLVGSVGVDFVLAEKPYILEINPRFQGSLDSVEWSCDVNIFGMHAKTFEGRLPEKPKPRRYAIRTVLFAPRDLEVKEDLRGNPFFADVPNKGDFYRKDDPLVSILASGGSREEVERRVVERRDLFLRLV
ncbi:MULTISPECIES: ATP-grasp domain-containing protein [unclassified Archaeoglobus]|jgi:hypothetical protein|uniref:ATP-grasp domain-containing protein n=1 Tax=unclassified Archaeoglobus TaxID=2643606 RepID=UPI0025B93EC1|nr:MULTISPECIES: ATP-grasp domain-containing protein [unclassified Archaeoglobus]